MRNVTRVTNLHGSMILPIVSLASKSDGNEKVSWFQKVFFSDGIRINKMKEIEWNVPEDIAAYFKKKV